MTMLTLSNLTKRYGAMTALNKVSLSVEAGERVALLGHNGAGKSTMMKLVLGLITPDGGDISIAGHSPGSVVARGLTAYLPENAAFHPALTGREQIGHFLRLRGEPVSKADDLLERVGLTDAARRRIGTYSKGMRQRIGLAQALIGTPQLMVLDEPTSGLDPLSRREFYVLLDQLAAQGTAILLSSHALSEVEDRTDRIVILSKGNLVSNGTLAQLRSEAALPLSVTLHPKTGHDDAMAACFPDARPHDGAWVLGFSQAQKLDVLKRITSASEQIEDFDIHQPSLDDVYEQISQRAA